jgi:DNA repair protein RecN (Recombination protein N)
MLRSLYIENIFLINKIHIEFNNGLNIFTGETGSGKSIILDSLNLVIGGRMKGNILKENCEFGSIIAEFELNQKNHHSIIETLIDNGYNIENNTLFLKRILNKNGVNKIFINDNPAGTKFVDSLTDKIIQINDQFSHTKLFTNDYFISIIDKIAKNDHKNNLDKLKNHYKIWFDYKNKLERLISENNQNKLRIEYDKMIFEDLKNLNLKDGEEIELSEKKIEIENSLQCIDKIKEIVEMSSKYQLLDGLQQISRIIKSIGDKIPKDLESSIQEVENSSIAIREFINQTEDIILENRDKMQELDMVQDRLFTLKSYAKKYNNFNESLYNIYNATKKRLNNNENFDDEIKKLENSITNSYHELISIAQEISQTRKENSSLLTKEIVNEMKDLKLENAIIKMDFVKKEISNDGIDKINCLASMNPGVAPQPLQEIASGGELARFMLAMKAVTSAMDNISTIVFDEIESGVSGNIMDKIADKMLSISDKKQVISITHSATIAAKADRHFKVSKKVENGETIVSLQELNNEERIAEIATILDGEGYSEVAINMAKKLINNRN